MNKNKICGIYCVTNKVNNKIYIGQSIDIERRWDQHKYGKGNLILRNAIKKYGLYNFTFEILEEVDTFNKNSDSIINELIDLEQKWFDKYEPYERDNGYNIQKTSKPNISNSKNENIRKKISKIKIDNNHCGKTVIQYDLLGNFIKKWESAANIERTLGYKAENISACCLKKNNSSNGYIWRFNNDKLTSEDIEKANKTIRLSKVRQYDLNGNLLNEYGNILIASKITGIKSAAIRKCCRGESKTSGGFIWKFRNEW